MVDISQETTEKAEARLLGVIKTARLTVYADPHAFQEFPLADFPHGVRSDALALVRDDQVWSQLVPCENLRLLGRASTDWPVRDRGSQDARWPTVDL